MMTNPNVLQSIKEQEAWYEGVERWHKLASQSEGRRSTQQCRELGDLMVFIKEKTWPSLPLKHCIDSLSGKLSKGYAMKLYKQSLARRQG